MEIRKSETLGKAACPRLTLNVPVFPVHEWGQHSIQDLTGPLQRVFMKHWPLVLW